jgi:dUTP pyrophosphatase
MKVRVKKLSKYAVIPSYSNDGDAGMDITAIEVMQDEYGNWVCRTGLAIEIPYGYVGLLFPRSSVCKTDMLLSNSVGVVDHGYTGEILFKFKKSQRWDDFNIPQKYRSGDRIGQIIIIPIPKIEFEETDELGTYTRGEKGFGSTGN